MKNYIAIVEIPTGDFERAVKFYEAILDITVERIDMGQVRMGLFPTEQGSANIALIHGDEYQPSAQGTIVFLNASPDLQTTLDKIEANGGHVIVSKTEIPGEMSFYAIFNDTEGNRVGLHSA